MTDTIQPPIDLSLIEKEFDEWWQDGPHGSVNSKYYVGFEGGYKAAIAAMGDVLIAEPPAPTFTDGVTHNLRMNEFGKVMAKCPECEKEYTMELKEDRHAPREIPEHGGDANYWKTRYLLLKHKTKSIKPVSGLQALREELDTIAMASLNGQGVAGRLQAIITKIDEGKYADVEKSFEAFMRVFGCE